MSVSTRPDCVTVHFKEYPDIEFPQALLDLDFEDHSWHNDVCARAVVELPNGVEVVVWCDYPDPQAREMQGKQFICGLDYSNVPNEILRTWFPNAADFSDWVEIAEADTIEELLHLMQANPATAKLWESP